MTGKAEFRKFVLEKVRALSPDALAAESAAICDTIVSRPEWSSAKVVCLFAPQPREPNVELLWAERGTRVFCYPRVNGVELDLLRVDDPAELRASRWELREPVHEDGRVVELAMVDLLLVPGVAFTAEGARLGRGGGFYDRLLARPGLRARTLGICFGVQLVEELPSEPHDRSVDAVISA